MKTALVFPGQGSHYPGMGRGLYDDFPEARKVFDEVDEALEEKLSTIIFEGPEDRLTLTENTQPALMAVSMAVMAVLRERFGLSVSSLADFVAGHSLGEYSALTASGALSLDDSARLLRLRGRAMQKAVPAGKGAMAAIIGLDIDRVEENISPNEQGICVIANDNTAGQVVISGEKSAVDNMVEKLKAAGAKRAVLLPVSAPFHCPLMEPATDIMREALANITILEPEVPIIANVTARPEMMPDKIRQNLEDQICARVRFRESLIFLHEQSVTRFIEAGAGKVLCGLAKRISSDFTLIALEDGASIEAFASEQKTEQKKETL